MPTVLLSNQMVLVTLTKWINGLPHSIQLKRNTLHSIRPVLAELFSAHLFERTLIGSYFFWHQSESLSPTVPSLRYLSRLPPGRHVLPSQIVLHSLRSFLHVLLCSWSLFLPTSDITYLTTDLRCASTSSFPFPLVPSSQSALDNTLADLTTIL